MFNNTGQPNRWPKAKLERWRCSPKPARCIEIFPRTARLISFAASTPRRHRRRPRQTGSDLGPCSRRGSVPSRDGAPRPHAPWRS
ncbi:hypothetical protein NL676_018603 [Syzygium grande]|nr:hypothetical protein NL676_018603 [Syzygium grande]